MSRNIRSTPQLRLESLEGREVPAVMFALTNSQRILAFDTSNPSVLLDSVAVRGLTSPGERLTDIDVRAANGNLYGRSTAGRVYLLDPTTGAATQVGGTVEGASVGIAFDPAMDQLRAMNFSGGNIALDASTGVLEALGVAPAYIFGDVFAGTPAHLSALAFTNNAPFASTTELYGIDHINNTFVRGIGDPNTGQMLTVAGFGIDFTSNVGFDINPIGNVGYLAIQPVNATGSLFGQINLNDGSFSFFGPVGSAAPLILDVAVADTFSVLGTASADQFLPPQPFHGGQPTSPDNPGGRPYNDVPQQTPFPTGTPFFPTSGGFFPTTFLTTSTPTDSFTSFDTFRTF